MRPPVLRRRLLGAGGLAWLGLPGWLSGCALPPRPQAPITSVDPAVHPSAPLSANAVPLPARPDSVAAPPLPTGEEPPPEPREFRAAWVATVANIDWPSRPGLSAAAMRSEALAILDRAQALRLNALILQVRPAGDALFASTLEPWSEYLSGEQGRPPWLAGEPAWDPLAFWVQEAHRRALELHAWFNPYRARHSAARSPLAAGHIAQRRPDLVQKYGDQLWMDPGQPEAAAHTLAVVADVVRRYDIDAVHIDDYFYPYPVAVDGVDQPFPDDAAWAAYQLGGGTLARDDWRRAQVDTLVQALQRTVQGTKPWVRVGISPFGLPKPDRRPPGVAGFSQYDKLYADVEKWFENGWLDYLAPQLYWPIDRAGQAFPVLLDYWLGANRTQRHLWPGLFTSRVIHRANAAEALGPNIWPGQELIDQVAVQRSRALAGGGPASGHIHFSMVALMQDRDGLATQLLAGAYAQAALVPATPWLPDTAPGVPLLQAGAGRVSLRVGAAGLGGAGGAAGSSGAGGSNGAVRRWAVWLRREGRWRLHVLPGDAGQIDTSGADRVVARAINRVGQAGPRATLRL